MLNKKALSAAVQAAAAGDVYVEDVFSTDLYSGNSSLQTITNGIDLSTNGGMVWVKVRSLGDQHALFDSARGLSKSLATNLTSAQYDWSGGGIDQFNSNGFRLDGNNSQFNDSTYIYTSWTFRKAAKFFDVVTYTGNGSSSRAINHNLGSTPGCVIVKRTDSTGRWKVYHRSEPTKNGNLNDTSAFDSNDSNMFFQGKISAVSSTTFTVAETTTGVNDVNGSTYSYVAYLFAHDAGGFGDNNDQSVIKCGSYTGNGSATGPTIDLGWEPQWILIKNASAGTSRWTITDNLRGFPVTSAANQQILQPHTSDAEIGVMYIQPTSTGFKVVDVDADVNTNGNTYIYVAIRRGPMKTPTDATKVFTPTVYTGTNVDNRLINTTIAPDFVMIRQRNDTVVPGMYTGARLTSQEFMITGSTAAGATDADSFDAQLANSAERGDAWSSMSGVWVGNDITRKFNANTTSNNHIIEAFKRAPGFFDVVCYKGDGSSNTSITHNLGVAPEFIIIKGRSNASSYWAVWTNNLGGIDNYLWLNTNAEKNESGAGYYLFGSSNPTSTTFNVGTTSGTIHTNKSGDTYVAYLFASLSGVSKVGSYTGNGSSQTINCGFTNGARFILIKRTDSTGDWYVYDSARGIVSGNDPQLKLNATDAEATGYDAIDPDNSGFIVNNDATNFPINVNNATYIYLAIA